jgi:ribonuclease P/MRP protein subunit POP5
MYEMVKQIKQKRLLPSLREKKRYVAYEVLTESKFTSHQIKETIILNFKELFGTDGLSKAGLDFVDFEDNKGIIRVSNKSLDMLKATFCFVRKLNKDDIVLRSLGVSGILKKVKNKFILGGRN